MALQINKEFFKHDAQAGGFFPTTHTNPGFDINKFIGESGQNYLIEGIRGTGKTHILKMINTRCIETYQSKKILPIYVSLASVSEWIERDIKLFRIHFYADIVKTAINTIEANLKSIELAGNSKGIKAAKRIAQMFGLNESENINIILEKIRHINENLINKLTYNASDVIERTEDEEGSNTKLSIGSNEIQMTIEDLFRHLENKEVRFVGTNLCHENASSFIVNFFKELKEVLNNSYSYILVDECSEVSKEAQVEIFRLFKLIRGAFSYKMDENTAYFCATVYPSPMTYYPSKVHGDSFNFEVGHDAIMEYIGLDELSDEYVDFYRQLTNNRIKELVNKESGIDTYKDIFESEKAFVLAAYFSNGIIRRYIEILKHSYDNLLQRTGGVEKDNTRMSTKDVEESLSVIVPNQILATSKLTASDFKILDDIVARLSKRNRKNETENIQRPAKGQLPANVYFTVSRGEALLLGNLLMQGVIHDKNKTRVKKYHKEGGNRGLLLVLDLSVAFHEGAISRTRASEIFTNDLIQNAKSGYLWCQDFIVESNLSLQ